MRNNSPLLLLLGLLLFFFGGVWLIQKVAFDHRTGTCENVETKTVYSTYFRLNKPLDSSTPPIVESARMTDKTTNISFIVMGDEMGRVYKCTMQ